MYNVNEYEHECKVRRKNKLETAAINGREGLIMSTFDLHMRTYQIMD